MGYCETEAAVELFDDMKNPPMDIEECLCKDCATIHAEEAIEELEQEIEGIKDRLTEWEYGK